MNREEIHEPGEPRDASFINAKAERERPEYCAAEAPSPLPQVEPSDPAAALEPQTQAGHEEEKPVALPHVDDPETAEIEGQQAGPDEMPLLSVVGESESVGSTPSIAAEPAPAPKAKSFFQERPPETIEVAPHVLRHWTRRDVLLFGVGAIAAAVPGGGIFYRRLRWNAWASSMGTRPGPGKSGFSTERCASTTMLQRLSTHKIAWYPLIQNRRSHHSRTITTAQLPIRATFRSGI